MKVKVYTDTPLHRLNYKKVDVQQKLISHIKHCPDIKKNIITMTTVFITVIKQNDV